MVPSKKHEWMVDLFLELGIKEDIKFFVGLFRGIGFYDANSITHSMNVCIHTDIGHIIEY